MVTATLLVSLTWTHRRKYPLSDRDQRVGSHTLPCAIQRQWCGCMCGRAVCEKGEARHGRYAPAHIQGCVYLMDIAAHVTKSTNVASMRQLKEHNTHTHTHTHTHRHTHARNSHNKGETIVIIAHSCRPVLTPRWASMQAGSIACTMCKTSWQNRPSPGPISPSTWRHAAAP